MKTFLRSLILFFAVAAGGQSAPAATASGCFADGPSSPMSVQSPSFPVVADFNHDGLPDVAVSNTASDGVSVLLGLDGFGTFTPAPQSPFQVGIGPAKLAVGDFNRDGNLDIAVACSISASMEILYGDGQGGFKEPTGKYAVGASSSQLVTADFTGDGRADLAVVNPNTNDVRIFLGKAGGSFSYGTSVKLTTPNSGPRGIDVGDFNGDRGTDFAVANFNTSTVEVFLGDGTGLFAKAAGSPIATGTGPYGLVAGDFNKDGKIDLATANQTSKNLTVLLGNGTGGFAPITTAANAVAPQHLATSDLNGDGFLDLITTNAGSSTGSIFLGNGTGGFTPSPSSPFTTGSGPTGIAVADLNFDRRQDLVVANNGSNTVSMLLNTCPNELDAEEIARQHPDAMIAGQSYNVSVTVKNTGARAWSYAKNDRLGSRSPRDNFTWGNFNRVLLPKGISVAPGASYTFNFTVTAPSAPGQYHFQWQMVEERVCWFGQMTSDHVITVK